MDAIIYVKVSEEKDVSSYWKFLYTVEKNGSEIFFRLMKMSGKLIPRI